MNHLCQGDDKLVLSFTDFTFISRSYNYHSTSHLALAEPHVSLLSLPLSPSPQHSTSSAARSGTGVQNINKSFWVQMPTISSDFRVISLRLYSSTDISANLQSPRPVKPEERLWQRERMVYRVIFPRAVLTCLRYLLFLYFPFVSLRKIMEEELKYKIYNCSTILLWILQTEFIGKIKYVLVPR